MKKTSIGTVGLLVVIVFIAVIWYKSSPSSSSPVTISPTDVVTSADTTVPSTATVKVSDKLSSYENAELGFSVKYPTSWEKDETDTGATFIMPIDKTQVSTLAKLQAEIGIASGKCSFPPVTTVKDRSTITVGSNTFNMISIMSTVQGRGYLNRMYSLQKGSICYVFTFSSITLDPVSKGLTGSNVTQAQNNNKAIVATADAAFTDMVKSFAFVSTPAGQDESTVPAVK